MSGPCGSGGLVGAAFPGAGWSVRGFSFLKEVFSLVQRLGCWQAIPRGNSEIQSGQKRVSGSRFTLCLYGKNKQTNQKHQTNQQNRN